MTDPQQAGGQTPSPGSQWPVHGSGQQPPTQPGPYGQPAYPTQPDQTQQYGQQAYPPPGYGYTPPTYPTYVSPPANPPTNGLAIASMIVSLVGFGPVGAIMGHIARKQIRESGEQGDGFALAGIIVGWVVTGIWVLACCLAVVPLFLMGGLSTAGGF